jgi:hypothetical protein
MTNLEPLTYKNIIDKFLESFPETAELAESEREYWDGDGEQLPYIFFGFVINGPLNNALRGEESSPYLNRIFNFFENMANSPDEMVRELLATGTLEVLGDDKKILSYARVLMGEKTLTLSHEIEIILGREIIDSHFAISNLLPLVYRKAIEKRTAERKPE